MIIWQIMIQQMKLKHGKKNRQVTTGAPQNPVTGFLFKLKDEYRTLQVKQGIFEDRDMRILEMSGVYVCVCVYVYIYIYTHIYIYIYLRQYVLFQF